MTLVADNLIVAMRADGAGISSAPAGDRESGRGSLATDPFGRLRATIRCGWGCLSGGRGFVGRLPLRAVKWGPLGALPCLLEGKDVTADSVAHQIGRARPFPFRLLELPQGWYGLRKVVSLKRWNTSFSRKRGES